MTVREWCFPGQGSQSVGMLAGYGDAAPVREVVALASEVLGAGPLADLSPRALPRSSTAP